ncbi:sec-independent protein translocase protein TatB [Insolitispirillum peregrinum]|uniref:Sec-independent protein translocase protein TatB n=2 Tax=Insolitispirillum peregrinum TaxID=80876 RepID=A0A1N7IWA7_9PROT|nr:sec-independent protein translocase protein TatB [Insolitispirillum peregrinum]
MCGLLLWQGLVCGGVPISLSGAVVPHVCFYRLGTSIMFDLGWDEIGLIVIVAVVVLGPKELPNAMRTAGQWMRKFRMLASDFQRHLDTMVQEAELTELRDKAKQLAQTDLKSELTRAVDADGTIGQSLQTPDLSSPTSTAAPAAPSVTPEPVTPVTPEAEKAPESAAAKQP